MFGSYVESHDDPTVTHNMNPITHDLIDLITTRNNKRDPEGFLFCNRKVTKEKKYHSNHQKLIAHFILKISSQGC